MSNSLDKVIEAAKAKAAEKRAENTQVAVSNQQGTAVAVSTPGKMLDWDDLGSSGLSVDAFLKVSDLGIGVKDRDGLTEEIIVKIECPQGIQIFEAAKYGNPAVYVKSYDRVNCTTGGLWADALEKAQRIDPNCKPYGGADISMEVLQDVKSYKAGKEVGTLLTAGEIVGFSTSTTNKANLEKFLRELKEGGYRNTAVIVKLGYEDRKNKNGQTWGVYTFELIGEYTDVNEAK